MPPPSLKYQRMPDLIVARNDPALSAKVMREVDMVYEDSPSDIDDRPPHVRAASGLVRFQDYLAVIQDDANWLALIDDDDRVHACRCPRGRGAAHVSSSSRGNKHEKFDLEIKGGTFDEPKAV